MSRMLYGFLLLLVLAPLIVAPWFGDNGELPRYLGMHLLGLPLFMLLASRPGEWRVPASWLHWPVLALLLVMLVATARSAIPVVSFFGAYQQYTGWCGLLSGVLLYGLAAVLVREESARLWVARAVSLSALVLAGYGILQHFGVEIIPWGVSAEAGTAALAFRSFATLGNPSFLGLYLAMALPLLSLCLLRKQRWWLRLAWTAGLLLVTVALVFTYSRAAMFASVIALGCVVPARHTSRWLLPALAGGGLALGLLLAPLGTRPSALTRITALQHIYTGSVQVRLELWQAGWTLMRERPLLGWGMDTFSSILPHVASPAMTKEQRSNPSAHNLFLDLGVQAGIVGILIALWLVAAAVAVYRRNHNPDVPETPMLPAIAGGLLAWFVCVLVGFATVAPMMLAWVLLGMLAGYGPDVRFSSRGGMGWSALTALLLWTLLTAGAGAWAMADNALWHGDAGRATRWWPWLDYYQVQHAQQVMASGEDGRPWLARAVWLNPWNAANTALLAQAEVTAGNSEAALALWQRTHAHDPNWLDAWNALGVAQKRQGYDEDALRTFRAILVRDPDFAPAWVNLGNLYFAKQQWYKAHNCYRIALRVKPGWSLAQENLTLVDHYLTNSISQTVGE